MDLPFAIGFPWQRIFTFLYTELWFYYEYRWLKKASEIFTLYGANFKSLFTFEIGFVVSSIFMLKA